MAGSSNAGSGHPATGSAISSIRARCDFGLLGARRSALSDLGGEDPLDSEQGSPAAEDILDDLEIGELDLSHAAHLLARVRRCADRCRRRAAAPPVYD